MAKPLPLDLQKWLMGVEEKLNDEGKQLLKLLYHEDLGYAPLVDEAKAPRDLLELSRRLMERSDEAALALFLHRLSLLIPRAQPDAENQDEIMKVKDLGAQDCIDYFQVCQLSLPSIQLNIPQESRLLECLVTVYVNLSQKRRKELKQQLADQVSVHHENFNIFELFCKLFQQTCNRHQEILNGLVNALNNAPPPEAVVENLLCQLNTYHIPHTLTTDDIRTQPESYDDYERIMWTLREEHHVIHEHHSISVCTKTRMKHCLMAFIPIALVIMAIAVSTAALSAYKKTDESVRKFEVSSYTHHQHCSDEDIGAPLIQLGSTNSFWYKNIQITQDDTYGKYVDVTVQFYAIPSELVTEHTREFSCNYSDGDGALLNLDQVYLLQGSVLSFNNCIQSKNEHSPGLINLSIYDNFTEYSKDEVGGKPFQQYQIHVEPNQTNCSENSFTVPQDGLYYAVACTSVVCPSTHAAQIFYKIDVKMKYVSFSDWADTSFNRNVCKLDAVKKECLISTDDLNKDWFFSAKTYDIFAYVTSKPVGLVKIRASFRSTVYIIPAVIGGVLMAIYICTCAGVRSCVFVRKKQKHKDQVLERRLSEY